MKPVVITDLDGTLLDPRDYSFEPALRALKLLREEAVPLILCSSKTRAEIELIRKRLENHDPFISENGGGIFIPDGYFPFPVEGSRVDGYRAVILGRPYSEIRSAFVDIRRKTGLRLRGFGDMSVKEVAALVGLSLKEAELAKKRDFDEPFIIEENKGAEARVVEEIERRGLCWTRGRLMHILGRHDKGGAVRILKEYLRRVHGEIMTIGLGDSLNDLPLLKEVDRPVLVRKPGGGYEPLEVEGLIRAQGVGPEGWAEAVLDILDRQG